MNDNYKIRNFKPEDIKPFLKLYQRVMGGLEHSKEWFKWKYMNNPYSNNIPIIVAEFDGELVGARPFFALEMVVGEKTVNALQPADTMVHPAHRRQGLFTRMTREALEKFQDSNYKLLFNFPNQNSCPGYLKLGWKKVKEIVTYYKFQNSAAIVNQHFKFKGRSFIGKTIQQILNFYCKTKSSSFSPENNLKIHRFNSFPVDEFVELYKKNHRSGIRANKDREFLRYRFANPDWEYTTYLLEKAGGFLGGCVVGTSDHTGYIRSSLMDMVYEDNHQACLLLKRVAHDFKDSALIEVMNNPNIFPPKLLKELGFISDNSFPLVKLKNRRHLVVRKLSSELDINRLIDSNNWNFTYLERDKR